jgi:hypothetical protein
MAASILRVTGSLREIPKLCLILSGLLLGQSLHGLSIVVSGGGVLMPDQATPVPEGSHASIGYFGDGFADFSGLHGRSWSDVTLADYVEVFRPSVFSGGLLTGSTSVTGLEGRQLYLWIFDSRDSPDLVGSTAFGLFTGGEGWMAKGDGIIPFDQNRLQVDSVTTATYGIVNDHGVSLAPIPEPSHIAVLFGLLSLGLGLWKHRISFPSAPCGSCEAARAGRWR